MANELYKPTPDEIKEILENHKHWIKEDCEGWEKMRADLSNADLRGADLSNADLSGAYLRGADLSNANLSNAYLRGADLSGADLSNADLSGADLRGADLSNAYLINANLINADLRGANLINAYLRGADLSNANLSNADLRGADLSNADLSNADLSNANLSNAYLINADLINADLSGADLRGASGITMACPSDGAFVGWKKAVSDSGFCIVKLQITEDAKRSSATGRKCRCDKAQVLAIYDQRGEEIGEAHSDRDASFIYRPGEIVVPDSFDDNRWNECSNGIHFFITRTEAEEYEL